VRQKPTRISSVIIISELKGTVFYI
jgi:hypothetical protein